jgi:uncharacterized protein YajQ (UPF0234 family)
MSKPMTDERLHALESQAVMGTVKTWCQGALLEACEEIRRLREENELLKHDKLMEEGINVALRKKIVKLRKVVKQGRLLRIASVKEDAIRIPTYLMDDFREALRELDEGENA